MRSFGSRLPGWTTLAWILASVVAFAAFLILAPTLLNPPKITPTLPALSPTPGDQPSRRSAPTPIVLPPLPVQQSAIPLPTIARGAKVYTFLADPTLSGYFTSGEEHPHWGDRNLHAGFFNGNQFGSAVLFDLSPLPP